MVNMRQINKEIRISILKRRLELFVLGIFILLLAGIFNFLYGGVNVIDSNYKEIMKTSNTEDFRFIPALKVEDHIAEITADYSIISEDLNKLSTQEIIDKYKVSTIKYEKKMIQELEQKYNFKYELYKEAIIEDGEKTYFVTPYQGEIDKMVFAEGKSPKSGEVAVAVQYANSQSIQVGDSIEIADKKYKVSGLTYGPLQLFLHSNQYSKEIFLKSNVGIIMNESDFENLDEKKSHLYLALFDSSVKNQADSIEQMRSANNVAYLATPDQVSTLNNIQTDLSTNYYLSIVSVITLLVITIILIIIILNNQLGNLNQEFGIMLAIGVKKSGIIKGFYIYGFFFLVFIILGTILGLIMQGGILGQFTSIYNIYFPLETSFLETISFGLLLELFLVFVVSLLVSLKLRVSALTLINDNLKLKTSSVLKFIKLSLRWLPTRFRIKSSFTFYKMSYLFTLFISMIVIVNLFVLGFSLQTSIERDFNEYENNLNYSKYGIFESSDTTDNNEIGIQAQYRLSKVNGLKLEKGADIPILGLKNEETSFSHINGLLKDKNGLIITKKIARQYDIKIGDKITLEINQNPKEFTVSNINPINLDVNNYLDIHAIWENDSSYDVNDFNIYFAKNDDDSFLNDSEYFISKSEETQRVKDSLNQINTLLSLLFFATMTISIVLLILIAKLSVTDNLNAIRVFNLLGYSRFNTYNLSIDVYKIPLVLFCSVGVVISPFIMNAFESLINNNESSIYISLLISPNVIIIIGVMLLIIYYAVFLLTYLIITRKNK
ncbi:hypothetical protein [Lysinibacillus xylanilyticus]|uniref:hypothetical protein n=1 Tax=Lysinibacillus xylanilyticus TaxID=582475 RepID=UPI003CFF8441